MKCIRMNILEEKAVAILERYRTVKHGGNAASMARELGVSPVTLGQWLNFKRSPNLAALAPVFAGMGVQIVEPNEKLAGYLFVDCGRARIAEDGSLAILPSPHPPFAFESNWLISMGLSPASCFLMPVDEPSMFPVDSFVLIDKEDTRLQNGQVYLVGLGQDLLLRRVFRTLQGISLHADAGTDPDLPVKDEERGHLSVFGRVRWLSQAF